MTEITVTIIPTSLVPGFCPFIKTKNKNQIFSKLVVWFKGMLNSIDFYKRILLHVIPVRIIVPWFNLLNAKVVII